MEAELIEAFEALGQTVKKDSEVLTQCVKMCEEFGLTAEGFSNKWESWTLNNTTAADAATSSVLTLSKLTRFRTFLKATHHATAARRPPPSHTATTLPRSIATTTAAASSSSSTTAAMSLDDVMMDMVDAASSATTQMVIKDTPNVEETLQFGDVATEKKSAMETVTVTLQTKLNPYLFMNESLATKAEALDAALATSKSALEAQLGLTGVVGDDQQEMVAPAFDVPTQDDVMAIGRVAFEEPEEIGAQAKLTSTTVVLQGPISAGTPRVKLLLPSAASTTSTATEEVEHVALFPGQVVAVKGNNPTGKLINVKKIFHTKPFPTAPNRHVTSEATSLKEIGTVIVAAGPFTASDNFEFVPLNAIVSVAAKESVDVLVLVGPFVDAEHPAIASLMTDFESLFRTKVATALERLPATTKVVIVPSTRDTVSQFPILPQPGLDPALCKNQAILMAPNPCVLQINDTELMGVCAADVIKHVSQQLVTCPSKKQDRMLSICEAIASQRSFYPLVPSDESTVVEHSLMAKHIMFQQETTPHILIVPSDLKAFAKQVPCAPERPAITFINPGRAATGHSAGRFAKITLANDPTSLHVEIMHL